VYKRNEVYYEQIAKNISANISSSINFSIDAGTSETWHNVKGFDNFNIVNTNLKKYRANSNHSEQIHLKYILILGVNTHEHDYIGVVKIMKELGINHLILSCDIRGKYKRSKKEIDELVFATASLIEILHLNNLKCVMQNYSPNESKGVRANFIKNLFKLGKVATIKDLLGK